MKHIRVTLGQGTQVWTREFRGEAIRWHISQLGNLSILEDPRPERGAYPLAEPGLFRTQVVPAAVFARGQWVGVENVEHTEQLQGVASETES